MSKGNEEGQAIPPEGQDGEPAEEKRLSRGKFIAAAGAAGAGLVVAGAPAAMAKSWSKGSRNKALTAHQHAPGMIGGPTGFPGAAALPVPGELGGGPGGPRSEGSTQGREGARHARRPGAQLRPAAVREQVPEGCDRVDRRHLGAGDRDQAQVRGDEPRLRVRDEHPQRLDQERQLRSRHRRDRGHGRLRRGGPAAAARRLRPQVPAELERPEVRLRRRPADGPAVHAVQRPHVLGRVRQRHAAVRVPLATCSTTPGRRRRSKTSTGSR